MPCFQQELYILLYVYLYFPEKTEAISNVHKLHSHLPTYQYLLPVPSASAPMDKLSLQLVGPLVCWILPSHAYSRSFTQLISPASAIFLFPLDISYKTIQTKNNFSHPKKQAPFLISFRLLATIQLLFFPVE